MTSEDYQKLMETAVANFPPFPDNMPENELKPDPARLRHDITMLTMRLERLEQWAKQMNPTFWNSIP